MKNRGFRRIICTMLAAAVALGAGFLQVLGVTVQTLSDGGLRFYWDYVDEFEATSVELDGEPLLLHSEYEFILHKSESTPEKNHEDVPEEKDPQPPAEPEEEKPEPEPAAKPDSGHDTYTVYINKSSPDFFELMEDAKLDGKKVEWSYIDPEKSYAIDTDGHRWEIVDISEYESQGEEDGERSEGEETSTTLSESVKLDAVNPVVYERVGYLSFNQGARPEGVNIAGGAFKPCKDGIHKLTIRGNLLGEGSGENLLKEDAVYLSLTVVTKNGEAVEAWDPMEEPDRKPKKEEESPQKEEIPLDTSGEYIYNTTDPGEDVRLDAERLLEVSNPDSAVEAVKDQVASMTPEQKNSPTGIDLSTLYAETAVSRAAHKEVEGSEILVSSETLNGLEPIAKKTCTAVEQALHDGGIVTIRRIFETATLTLTETGPITILIDPDVLDTGLDKIQVETPDYALTFKLSDLEEDLQGGILTFGAQTVGTAFGPGSKAVQTTVLLNMPNGKSTNPVTVSLPKSSGDTSFQSVVRDNGKPVTSKYNPATNTVNGKITDSGQYTVKTTEKDFTDISNKSAEMQTAIRYLASRGIITGTGKKQFSPDASISRAEIAALLVRTTGKLNNGLSTKFKDVSKDDWYYAAAASSQKCGLVKGFGDKTFRGLLPIQKDQIVAMAVRVLKQEMGYQNVGSPAAYLSKYSDAVAQWAQPEVALATKENLVVYRTDGTFAGTRTMTRGDAAVILYRLFKKIW